MSHFLAGVVAYNLILRIYVVVNWQLSKNGICWPVSHGQIGRVFLKFYTDKLLVLNWLRAQLQVDILQWVQVYYLNWIINSLTGATFEPSLVSSASRLPSLFCRYPGFDVI